MCNDAERGDLSVRRSVGRSMGWSVLDGRFIPYCTWNKHDFILRHFQI